jgi:hypothetical protein
MHNTVTLDKKVIIAQYCCWCSLFKERYEKTIPVHKIFLAKNKNNLVVRFSQRSLKAGRPS